MSGRHVTEEEVLHTYTLQLIGPRDRHSPPFGLFADAVREAQENLTDLLPEGYSARIREWDEEETPNV